jgi:hypothetical protein
MNWDVEYIKKWISQAAITFVIIECTASTSAPQQPDQGALTSLPYVQVSKTTVIPTDLHSGGTAVVTVSIFQQSIPKGHTETVTLEVGTGRALPQSPDSAATYSPAEQAVHLSGDSGNEVARVKVPAKSSPSGHSSCTIIILASLAKPSAGITIKDSDPPDDGQATLTIYCK